MQLRIALFAALRERMGSTELLVDDLPDGIRVGELRRVLAERFPELGALEQVSAVVGTSLWMSGSNTFTIWPATSKQCGT